MPVGNGQQHRISDYLKPNVLHVQSNQWDYGHESRIFLFIPLVNNTFRPMKVFRPLPVRVCTGGNKWVNQMIKQVACVQIRGLLRKILPLSNKQHVRGGLLFSGFAS